MINFIQLFKSVVSEKDATTLNNNVLKLYSMHQFHYEDFQDLIQDAILYNLNKNHRIDAANLYLKIKYLYIDRLRHKSKISIQSLEKLIEDHPTTYNEKIIIINNE
jgi:hypothetical protein